MMFVIPNTTVLGGRGFSIKRGSFRYLRTASGYPVTLHAPMPGKPKRITVYGADGGVGDRTANQFDDSVWLRNYTIHATEGRNASNPDYDLVDKFFYIPSDAESLTVSQSSYNGYGIRIGWYSDTTAKSFISYADNNMGGAYAFAVPSGATYFRVSKRKRNPSSYFMVNAGSTTLPYEPYGHKIPILAQGRNLCPISNVSAANISLNTTVKAGVTYTFAFQYDAAATKCIGFNLRSDKLSGTNMATLFAPFQSMTAVNAVTLTPNTDCMVFLNGFETMNIKNLMIVEGSYTAETMPAYEPYVNHTIKLYSGAQLLIGDSLTVNPETETAARGTTDVTALQDWAQDMTLPEADELTVSAGTAIEPERIEVEYYSKMKGDN